VASKWLPGRQVGRDGRAFHTDPSRVYLHVGARHGRPGQLKLGIGRINVRRDIVLANGLTRLTAAYIEACLIDIAVANGYQLAAHTVKGFRPSKAFTANETIWDHDGCLHDLAATAVCDLMLNEDLELAALRWVNENAKTHGEPN
tara:strand:+ start:267 stop:701 length:435 start_codon:yes stop_codon:yes gene_type:complete